MTKKVGCGLLLYLRDRGRETPSCPRMESLTVGVGVHWINVNVSDVKSEGIETIRRRKGRDTGETENFVDKGRRV